MSILFFLIPLSLILLSLAIWAFFWAVKHDQFDDLEGPAYSILFDDEDEKKQVEKKQVTKSSVEDSLPNDPASKEPEQ